MVRRSRSPASRRIVRTKFLPVGAVDPRCAQDDVPRIAGANALLAGKLAAAIGIERRGGVRFNIGSALAAIEHVVGRDVNERNAEAASLGGKPSGCLGVDGERCRFLAFGTIDVGIGRGIDHRAPGLFRDHAAMRADRQDQAHPHRRHDLNVLGQGQGLKLLADLASPAEQKQPHHVSALI